MITMTHKSSINDMPVRRFNVLFARWITIVEHAETAGEFSGQGFFAARHWTGENRSAHAACRKAGRRNTASSGISG